MRARLFLISLALSSAACAPEAAVTDAAATEAEPARRAVATATAAPAPGEAEAVGKRVEESTGRYEFTYAWPAEAAAHPTLRALLEAKLARARAAIRKESANFASEAANAGFTPNPYAASSEWKVVADLPGFLSLSEDIYSYTGGAHGITGKTALVFDKRADAVRESGDLFRSPAALWQAVGPRFCAALDAEREKRRGAPVDPDDELFGTCPKLEELTLLLGSSNGRSFDRLALYAGPYLAGPYAEGPYEIDLSIDAAVLAAVRPEFRAAFSARR